MNWIELATATSAGYFAAMSVASGYNYFANRKHAKARRAAIDSLVTTLRDSIPQDTVYDQDAEPKKTIRKKTVKKPDGAV